MIYLDNHATTRCDPRVVEAMLPWLSEHYGNPHSTSHSLGREAAEMVLTCTEKISSCIGAPETQLVFTSGATESNNLALKGVCLHPRQKRRKIVTVTTEHAAVLDVCDELARHGFEVVRVPVLPHDQKMAGVLDLDALADAVDDDTALVSVMWANNEIGAIAPMAEVAEICHRWGALLHSDATQAMGRIPVSMLVADVDLVSASAHKFYGPKGIGFLAVGNGNRRVRLKPEIVGGGQQSNLRSGTLQPAGIIALTKSLEIAVDSLESENARVLMLRNQLAERLFAGIEALTLNGPPLTSDSRLAGNLNVMLTGVEGETWMSAAPDVAFSSGSACSSVDPEPSHVLLALGLTESAARRSVRFGVGRFNTTDEIDQASQLLVAAFERVLQQET
jgi:cysteine desulfurase